MKVLDNCWKNFPHDQKMKGNSTACVIPLSFLLSHFLIITCRPRHVGAMTNNAHCKLFYELFVNTRT